MNDKINAAVEEAIAPLKQEIDNLKAQLEALAPLAEMAKAMEPPKQLVEAQAIVKTIPAEVSEALGIIGVRFDPKMAAPWVMLCRKDGTTISVKKTEVDFRIRIRDQVGSLIKGLNVPFNGLVASLKSLA
jgi:hypothetical protein